MKRSIWLPIRLALCFAVLSLCPLAAYGEGSSSLAGVATLDGAREELFRMRDSGSLSGGHPEMMGLAKDPDLEHKLRGKPLGELMEGVAYKETGSPPAKSRGLMSDIDRTVSSLDDFNKVKEKALKLKYKIEETPYRIKIEGLDTVIWKPSGKSSALADPATGAAERARINASIQEIIQRDGLDKTTWRPEGKPSAPADGTSVAGRARILASDPEVAFEAGQKAGAHSFMSVAENLIKGQEALLGDLSKLPPWKAELKIVDGAKDVLRSLQAANMCTGEMKSVCTELEAIRKMDKPPGGDLLQKQKELRGLMGNAFEKSQILLDIEMDALMRRMQDAVDPDEIAHLQGRVAELRGQMTEGVERFRMLEEKFPNEMRQMSGGKSAAQIRDEMIRRGVKLEEGRRKLAATKAADDRAKDRAKKVEKISFVVDALQFVECLHQEGKDVTSCLKEAAEGLVMAEALAKGTYVISLVSETGAVIVSGTLSVAGLGATMYFTGAKLGEAAYEAMEYLEARQREKAALAGMEESQQGRVQNLALQLEKLEAQVKRFIAETVARKEQILADLDKYEQLAGIMKEATAYRDRQGPRLDTIQAALAKAAPPCQEIQGTGESLRRRLEQAGTAAQKVEALLRGAQKQVKECAGQGAVDKGNGSYQEAEKLVQQNRESMRSLETDRRNLRKARTDFQAALGEAGGEGKLDEAREALGRLDAYAAEAEANLVDIVGVSDRVAAIENDIEAKKNGFKGDIQAFKYAFPEHLTREWVEKYGFPQEMAASWLARLDKLEKTVAALQPMGDAAWREKRMKVMAENPALGADAKLFIQEVRQRGPRLKGMADSVDACLPGSGGAAGATEKTIEEIDTEHTLVDLAFAKLGKEYLDLRTACTQKQGGKPVAPPAGPAPDASKKEVFFVLQEGYPKVNPENVGFQNMVEFKNMVVDASGLTVELRDKSFPRWGRSECDQKVRFTFGRPPSVLKPDEVFEITFLGKAYGEEAKLCETYFMDVDVNPRGTGLPAEGLSSVGLVGRLEGGKVRLAPVYESKRIFKHAAPLDAGKDKVLDIDLMLGNKRRGMQADPVVRYRYVQKDLSPDEARTLLASRSAGGPSAPPQKPVGQPEGTRPETLAAGLLLLEMLTGDVTIYFGSPAEAQPLKSAGQLKPGATVQAGRGSQAAIKTPGGASVRIGENSKVKMAGQEPASKKQVVEVLVGTVEVNRKEDLPGFDDVKVRTRDSQAWATQTRYKVRVTERGTTYEVSEGTIHITGQMLAKTNADFQVVGKYSFAKEMDLHAGEKAIAFKVGSGQAASPPSSQLPSWATGGSQATAPADGPSRPGQEPWNDPKVQALMDEWLRKATPTVAAERPGQWRFSEWGQVLGPGSIATSAPDHPAGWSRHQSLWAVRDKFDSLNLCTMGQYIERRRKGEGLEGCAKPGGGGRASAKPTVPAWLSPAGASPGQEKEPETNQPLVKQSEDAVSRARQQLAEQKQNDQRRKEEEARAEQDRIAQKQRAAEERLRAEERRQAQAEAERARQKAQPDFVGDWTCTIEEGFSGKTSPANFSIVKQGAGYVLVIHTDAGDDRTRPALANGSTVVFVREFSRVTMTLTFHLDGDRLTGIDHIDRDNGTTNDYPITCVR